MNRFVFYFISSTIIFQCNCVNSQDLQSFNHDIDFQAPHVIVDYDLDSLTRITLNAFTTKNIKQFEDQPNSGKKYNRLTWMSLGYPKLLETKQFNSNLSRIFHFYDGGFFTFIETLNIDYKHALTRALFDKYSINVTNAQIVNIPLSYFGCEIEFYDQNNTKIMGQVKNFDQHPYKVMFKAPLKSTERNLFEEKIKINERNIFVNCKIESQYKDEKITAFKLIPNDIKELNLIDKLFEKNEFVYLIRYQVDSLSNEIYSSFDVLEIDEEEFNKTFYHEFMKKVYFQKFSHEKFDQVVKSLSKYSLNIDQIANIEIIKKEFGKLFKLNQNGNKKFISIDSEFVDNLRKKNKNDELRIGSESGVGGLCVETSVQFVRNKEVEWSKYSKSIVEQISELNCNNEDGIEWELKVMQILPKSLNVVKLKKSSFLTTTFHFPGVKIVQFIPKFQRSFTINSNNIGVYKSPNYNFSKFFFKF